MRRAPSTPDVIASMKKQTAGEIRRLALVDCFAKATWTALGFAAVCLIVDSYAIFGLPHHRASDGTQGATVFAVTLWVLEIVLAILALGLVVFAFSRAPRFPESDDKP